MLVRDKANSLQVELLCVHVYLELVLGRKSLASRHDLECCKDVVLLGITFMFPFHLVFALVARKFVCFVPLEVLVQAIFDDLTNFLLAFRRVIDRFFRHDLHVVF